MRLLLFQILVEPAEELAVPDERILRFEHLVRFVLELDEPCRNAADTGGGEGFERLRVRDAEVVFAREYKYRRVPLVHRLVRRIGIRTHRQALLLSQ